MAAHPPHVHRFVPPSEDEAAEARAEHERRRAERETAREAARPARVAAISAGPPLRDVEAAVDCMCSCHPRPADPDRHGGGHSCPCQETEAERSTRMESLRELLNELAGDHAAQERHFEAQQDLVATEAKALGVEARIEVWGAPHVLVGVCDGRAFYLRERHGSYRVTIAPDDAPGSDPWVAEPTETSIDIAAGDDHELEDDAGLSWVVALRVAVGAVRTASARNACAHRRVGSEPYCPTCGVRIDEAAAWRWTQSGGASA